jgi:hypothetical protein
MRSGRQAARHWQELPVTIAASCVGSTKTKAMTDKNMPLAMRLMGRFGTTPERSALNAVRFLTMRNAAEANGSILRKPKSYSPDRLKLDTVKAARLWDITGELARQRGLALP